MFDMYKASKQKNATILLLDQVSISRRSVYMFCSTAVSIHVHLCFHMFRLCKISVLKETHSLAWTANAPMQMRVTDRSCLHCLQYNDAS